MMLLALEAGISKDECHVNIAALNAARALWYVAATNTAFDEEYGALLMRLEANVSISTEFLLKVCDILKRKDFDALLREDVVRQLMQLDDTAFEDLRSLTGDDVAMKLLCARWGCNTEGKSNCPITGLDNIGNSCYFNSALQLLFRVYGNHFMQLAKSDTQKTHTQVVSAEMRLLATLVRHVRGEARGWSSSSSDLHALLSAVQRLNPEARTKFQTGRQSDSSSIATHILSLIEVSFRQLPTPYYFMRAPMVSSGDAQWAAFCAEHNFMFTQAQCGQVKTEIVCDCSGPGFEPPDFSGFSSLSISASAANLRNVQDAVDLWGKDGTPLTTNKPIRCTWCGEKEDWRQRNIISRFPATGVLLVTINREYHDHNGMAKKWSDGVELPATVTFYGEGGVEYEVEPVATCIHSGTVQGGHYYCTVAQEGGGGSVTANDSWVSTSPRPITCTTQGSFFAFQLKRTIVRNEEGLIL